MDWSRHQCEKSQPQTDEQGRSERVETRILHAVRDPTALRLKTTISRNRDSMGTCGVFRSREFRSRRGPVSWFSALREKVTRDHERPRVHTSMSHELTMSVSKSFASAWRLYWKAMVHASQKIVAKHDWHKLVLLQIKYSRALDSMGHRRIRHSRGFSKSTNAKMCMDCRSQHESAR